jgi:hypothetical protein
MNVHTVLWFYGWMVKSVNASIVTIRWLSIRVTEWWRGGGVKSANAELTRNNNM